MENELEDFDDEEDEDIMGGDLELDENEKKMLELAEANDMDDLDDIELVKEVKHYAPQLIENITLKVA